MNKVIYTTSLTGTKMSQLGKVGDQIKEGDVLAIVPRPDNAYDSQAMSVHFGPDVTSPQVGWIPAKEFEDKIVKGVLFNLMKFGVGLQARVVQYIPETKFLRVDVELVDDEISGDIAHESDRNHGLDED